MKIDLSALPKAENSEKVILGSILVDGEISRMVADLTTEDFFSDYHKMIYAACLELEEENETINPLSVAERMKEIKAPAHLCQPSILMQLTFGVPPQIDYSREKKRIKEKSAERAFIKQTLNTVQKLITKEISLDNAISGQAEAIKNIKEDFTPETSSFVSLGKLVDTVLLPEIDNYRNNKTSKIPLNIPYLDEALRGGVAKKQLIVLSAKTGGGKSILAWHLAASMANMRTSCAFASLEMDDIEILERALIHGANYARDSGYSMDDLRPGLPSVIYDALEEYATQLRELPVYLSTKSQTLTKLRREAEYLIEEKNIRLLIVDYLQLVKNEYTRNRSRTDLVEEVARGLKELARDLDLPVVTLSQLNREGSKDKDTKANALFNFKGSSEIEQAADIAFYFEFEESDHDWRSASITISKGRNIAKRPVELMFNPVKMSFKERL